MVGGWQRKLGWQGYIDRESVVRSKNMCTAHCAGNIVVNNVDVFDVGSLTTMTFQAVFKKQIDVFVEEGLDFVLCEVTSLLSKIFLKCIKLLGIAYLGGQIQNQ